MIPAAWCFLNFLISVSLISLPLLDALAVLKGMLDSGMLPTRPAVIALIQALAEKGDVKNLEALENILGDVTKSIHLSASLMPNAIALAHTKR